METGALTRSALTQRTRECDTVKPAHDTARQPRIATKAGPHPAQIAR